MGAIEQIDEEIQAIQNRIANLESSKRMYVQKSEGVTKLRSTLDKMLADHALTEREFLTIISDRIVDFVKASEPNPGETGPRFWNDLADYFEEAKVRRRKPVSARKKKTTEAKLPPIKAGRYLNPHTGLFLVKIKRPTREFQAWIDEYGAETVMGWRVGD